MPKLICTTYTYILDYKPGYRGAPLSEIGVPVRGSYLGRKPASIETIRKRLLATMRETGVYAFLEIRTGSIKIGHSYQSDYIAT